MAFTKCTFLIDCAHKTIYYCLFTTIMAYEYLCCVYNITSITFKKMRIRFIFLKTYYFISKVKSKRMSWIRCFEMMFVVRCNVNPCSSLQIQRWISLFSFSFNVFFTFICILFINFFLYIFIPIQKLLFSFSNLKYNISMSMLVDTKILVGNFATNKSSFP